MSKLGDRFNIPEDDLEKYRQRRTDNISPFKNFARINLDELQKFCELLSAPERKIFMSLLRRLHARNMVVFTREELAKWIKDDYGWKVSRRHLSTHYTQLRKKLAVKEIGRVTQLSGNGAQTDMITCCINPYLLYKGDNKQHFRLLNQWDNDDIVPPREKQSR